MTIPAQAPFGGFARRHCKPPAPSAASKLTDDPRQGRFADGERRSECNHGILRFSPRDRLLTMDSPVQSPSDRSAEIRALLKAGRFKAAEAAALAFCAARPGAPTPFALYARCAEARDDTREALRRWSDCRERFPGATARWRMGLAHALLATGRAVEAEREYSAALARIRKTAPRSQDGRRRSVGSIRARPNRFGSNCSADRKALRTLFCKSCARARWPTAATVRLPIA